MAREVGPRKMLGELLELQKKPRHQQMTTQTSPVAREGSATEASHGSGDISVGAPSVPQATGATSGTQSDARPVSEVLPHAQRESPSSDRARLPSADASQGPEASSHPASVRSNAGTAHSEGPRTSRTARSQMPRSGSAGPAAASQVKASPPVPMEDAAVSQSVSHRALVVPEKPVREGSAAVIYRAPAKVVSPPGGSLRTAPTALSKGGGSRAQMSSTARLRQAPANTGSGNARRGRAVAAAREDYSGGPNYGIGPEDVLHVDVWGNEELTGDYTVRPDGRISMPLIQDIKAEGTTSAGLARVIQEKLGVYIKDPNVSVIVKEVNAPKFSVLGYVTKPGTYPLRGDLSVLQALSQAGGFTPFASPGKIKIIRNVQGKQESRRVNYYDLISGTGGENYLLKPGDTIVVP